MSIKLIGFGTEDEIPESLSGEIVATTEKIGKIMDELQDNCANNQPLFFTILINSMASSLIIGMGKDNALETINMMAGVAKDDKHAAHVTRKELENSFLT